MPEVTIMRVLHLALAATLAVSASILFTTSHARAEGDRFDVSVASGGTVTVTPHGGWHINKDYPWKIVAGATKLDKSAFNLGDTKATVSGVPTGPATLSGAVCSD